MTFEFTDRYKATGTPYPDPETMCKGQCEGMGWVPVHKDDLNDEEGNWHDLWLEAEAKKPTDDNYHFVVCPTCNGTRLNNQQFDTDTKICPICEGKESAHPLGCPSELPGSGR